MLSIHDTLQHVGLIPDGSRRWATAHGVQEKQAYQLTARKVTDFIDFFFGKGITSISVYLLSKDNFKRSPEDLQAVLEQIPYFYCEGLPSVIVRWQANVIQAGLYRVLSREYQQIIDSTCSLSRQYATSDRRIYLCLAYNPVDELLQAIASATSPQNFLDCLWVPDTIDLVIRTAGDTTLSNFLPLQCGYARIHTIDKLILDVTDDDLESALREYYSLPRRYGI